MEITHMATTGEHTMVQDMLQLALNQRTNAQNECLQLGSQLLAAQRKIAELEAMLKDKDKDKVVEPELPLSNGHAAVDNSRESELAAHG